MVRLLPSLLAADFANLERDIKKIENYADGLHLDIMDGQFVPNISFGIPVLKSLREITNMHFDTHLMIINPENYIENFAEFSNAITVHYEASTHLHRIVNQIKEKGCQAGVSLNPHTPVSVLEEILPELDKVLIMSVNPGFTGQKFIPSILLKVKKLKEMSEKLNPNLEIIVDGGVGEKNIKELFNNGANSFVVGAAVFHAENPEKAIKNLREIIDK